MKTLKQHLTEKLAKKGFIIVGMPRAIDNTAIKTATEAVIEWLKEKQEEANDRYATGEAYLYKQLIAELKEQ